MLGKIIYVCLIPYTIQQNEEVDIIYLTYSYIQLCSNEIKFAYFIMINGCTVEQWVGVTLKQLLGLVRCGACLTVSSFFFFSCSPRFVWVSSHLPKTFWQVNIKYIDILHTTFTTSKYIDILHSCSLLQSSHICMTSN